MTAGGRDTGRRCRGGSATGGGQGPPRPGMENGRGRKPPPGERGWIRGRRGGWGRGAHPPTMTAGRQWQPAPAGGVPPTKKARALPRASGGGGRASPPPPHRRPSHGPLLPAAPHARDECGEQRRGGRSGRRPPRGGGWVVGTVLWSRAHRAGRAGAGVGGGGGAPRNATRACGHTTSSKTTTTEAQRRRERRPAAAAESSRVRGREGAAARGPGRVRARRVGGRVAEPKREQKKTKKKAVAPSAVRKPRSPLGRSGGGTAAADVTPLGTRPAWACWPSRGTPTRQAGPPPPLSTTHPIWDGVVCRKSRQTPTSGVRPLPSPSVGPRMGARQRVPEAGQGRRPSWSACHLSVGGMGDGRARLPPPGRLSNRAVAHAALPANGHALTVR